MRAAIDKYKDYADLGLSRSAKARAPNNWPETLEILVEGVKLPGPDGKKMRFLRRIPRGSVHAARPNGACAATRTTPSPLSWGGQNVFDVYSKTRRRPGWKALFRMANPCGRCGSEMSGGAASRFVELMVVITIIVILISMAIPIYNRPSSAPRKPCCRTTYTPCAR